MQKIARITIPENVVKKAFLYAKDFYLYFMYKDFDILRETVPEQYIEKFDNEVAAIKEKYPIPNKPDPSWMEIPLKDLDIKYNMPKEFEDANVLISFGKWASKTFYGDAKNTTVNIMGQIYFPYKIPNVFWLEISLNDLESAILHELIHAKSQISEHLLNLKDKQNYFTKLPFVRPVLYPRYGDPPGVIDPKSTLSKYKDGDEEHLMRPAEFQSLLNQIIFQTKRNLEMSSDYMTQDNDKIIYFKYISSSGTEEEYASSKFLSKNKQLVDIVNKRAIHFFKTLKEKQPIKYRKAVFETFKALDL